LLYFQQLFTSSESVGLQDYLAVVQPQVTQAMNDNLLRTFSPEEVDTTLSQMYHLNASGIDGFGVCFYQQYWNTIRGTNRKVILDFLNLGFFDNSINSTYIALIPKISPAVAVSEFRPISLCNVLYKIIAKVLANRLKKVLSSIISQQQSAFVPSRLILDNIMVAYEALHTMHTQMKGKKGFMEIKLDMSKAYNKVE